MSFLNFISACKEGITSIIDREDVTMQLLEMNQLRTKVFIEDFFGMLKTLQDKKCFTSTMKIAKRQNLQREFLERIICPDFVWNDEEDELVKLWHIEAVEKLDPDTVTLGVSLRSLHNMLVYVEVSDAIQLFCMNEGHTLTSKGFYDNVDEVIKAVRDSCNVTLSSFESSSNPLAMEALPSILPS